MSDIHGHTIRNDGHAYILSKPQHNHDFRNLISRLDVESWVGVRVPVKVFLGHPVVY